MNWQVFGIRKMLFGANLALLILSSAIFVVAILADVDLIFRDKAGVPRTEVLIREGEFYVETKGFIAGYYPTWFLVLPWAAWTTIEVWTGLLRRK